LCARVENGNVMMEVEEEQTGRRCPDKWDDAGDLYEGRSRYDWCDGSYEEPENGNQSEEEKWEDGN
jgi:hypothetical protein